MRVLHPSAWPRPLGYANGVLARGQMIFVAGMIGWDADGHFSSDEIAAQVRQALTNVVTVLAEANAKPENIVRMTWYVTDLDAYASASKAIGETFREIIGSFNAAMTVVQVSRLLERRAKVEIEVTAVLPDSSREIPQ